MLPLPHYEVTHVRLIDRCRLCGWARVDRIYRMCMFVRKAPGEVAIRSGCIRKTNTIKCRKNDLADGLRACSLMVLRAWLRVLARLWVLV